MKKNNQPELAEQITFMDLVVLNRQHGRTQEVRDAMELCYGTLNGAHLGKAQAGKAKASCAAEGIPDINVDVPGSETFTLRTHSIRIGDVRAYSKTEKNYHGLRIEMKHGHNTLSEAQERKKKLLEAAGYKYAVCYSAKEAIRTMVEYLPFDEQDYQGLKEFL